MNTAYQMQSINIITRRMRHHAQASGYDRLADFLDGNLIRPVTAWGIYQRAVARAGRFLINRAGSRWYHRDSFMSELHAAGMWLRNNNQIFHFLYGENSYRYLGNLKPLNDHNRIICTYHTPEEKFNWLISNKTPLSRLDAVIVVSSVQQEMFSDILDHKRIHFIPHGIDVVFYKPLESLDHNKKCTCICVGTHLRDFDAFKSAAMLLKDKAIEFLVVASASHAGNFTGLDNVRLLSGVGDNQLLSLYQSSDLFVMPVTDCTANNALLEAMACGLPVVATDLQGIRDYVNESCAILTRKGDAHALADGIEYLAGDEDTRRQMARASREHSLTFAWERIAGQVKQLYEGLWN